MTTSDVKSVNDPIVITSMADVEAIENVPFESLGLAESTYDLIFRSAENCPDKIAIYSIDNGTAWRNDRDLAKESLSIEVTYRELLDRINQTANTLSALGVGPDDVVSMLLPNVPEAHYVLWGGETVASVNPINFMLEPEVIAEIIDAAGSKVLVAFGDHEQLDIAQKLEIVEQHAPAIETILIVGSTSRSSDKHLSYDEALSHQPKNELIFKREITPDTVASLFHTGGTTGIPKLAKHSHKNEVYTAWATGEFIGPISDSCYLVGLPLFHCNAAIATGLSVFAGCGTIVLAGINGYRTPGILANFYQLVEHYGITNMSAVPTVYAALMEVGNQGCDISSLRYGVCGAAPMPVELFHSFQEKTGIKLIEGYGLTEATVCSTLSPPGGEPRIGSVGVRLPYTNIKIAQLGVERTITRECDVDEVGSILIGGPAVTPGYTDSSKNSELWVMDHSGRRWLETGDLGRQDIDGYFWLTGRSKELIIRGGHNIDPKMIEEVLAAHPAVILTAAVGRPDAYAGEIPVAYVTTSEDVTEQQLLDYCKQHIGERAAIPKAITILEEMPATGVGKIHKLTLSEKEVVNVVLGVLNELFEDRNLFSVEANQHPKLGMLASIHASFTEPVSAADTAGKIHAGLNNFSFHHELSWEHIEAN